MFGEGISKEGEIVDYGVKMDIIDKSGAWFSYGEMRLGQGRENVKALLKENKELREELEHKIKEEMGLKTITIKEEGAKK
jgi:recombination protein RecA